MAGDFRFSVGCRVEVCAFFSGHDNLGVAQLGHLGCFVDFFCRLGSFFGQFGFLCSLFLSFFFGKFFFGFFGLFGFFGFFFLVEGELVGVVVVFHLEAVDVVDCLFGQFNFEFVSVADNLPDFFAVFVLDFGLPGGHVAQFDIGFGLQNHGAANFEGFGVRGDPALDDRVFNFVCISICISFAVDVSVSFCFVFVIVQIFVAGFGSLGNLVIAFLFVLVVLSFVVFFFVLFGGFCIGRFCVSVFNGQCIGNRI